MQIILVKRYRHSIFKINTSVDTGGRPSQLQVPQEHIGGEGTSSQENQEGQET